MRTAFDKAGSRAAARRIMIAYTMAGSQARTCIDDEYVLTPIEHVFDRRGLTERLDHPIVSSKR